MITKEDIIAKAEAIGFDDIGFTTADSLDAHKEVLLSLKAEYEWLEKLGVNLVESSDPKSALPDAKTIIVVLDLYFRESFPPSIENHFGRFYLDDDRVMQDRLSIRLKNFRSFLKEHGIESTIPHNIPHRVTAAKAGLGTFGKNCLFYSRKAGRKSSWVLPIAIVIDHEFTPDDPTLEINCPDYCRNACVAACPTRALKGNARITPAKCISYLTYHGEDLPPVEIREAMGHYVYGCDRCQNVCPRNQAWLAQELPLNDKVLRMAPDFDLSRLLHMDKDYFETKIWPHMFYMGYQQIWHWKMNVARVMGNSLDTRYIPDLCKAFGENEDYRVKSMAAWALGRIGGPEAKTALETFSNRDNHHETVKKEIEAALATF